MPEELNKDQQAGLATRNAALTAYAKEAKLEAFLDDELLDDHSKSLGTAKALLRGKAQRAKRETES